MDAPVPVAAVRQETVPLRASGEPRTVEVVQRQSQRAGIGIVAQDPPPDVEPETAVVQEQARTGRVLPVRVPDVAGPEPLAQRLERRHAMALPSVPVPQGTAVYIAPLPAHLHERRYGVPPRAPLIARVRTVRVHAIDPVVPPEMPPVLHLLHPRRGHQEVRMRRAPQTVRRGIVPGDIHVIPDPVQLHDVPAVVQALAGDVRASDPHPVQQGGHEQGIRLTDPPSVPEHRIEIVVRVSSVVGVVRDHVVVEPQDLLQIRPSRIDAGGDGAQFPGHQGLRLVVDGVDVLPVGGADRVGHVGSVPRGLLPGEARQGEHVRQEVQGAHGVLDLLIGQAPVGGGTEGDLPGPVPDLGVEVVPQGGGSPSLLTQGRQGLLLRREAPSRRDRPQAVRRRTVDPQAVRRGIGRRLRQRRRRETGRPEGDPGDREGGERHAVDPDRRDRQAGEEIRRPLLDPLSAHLPSPRPQQDEQDEDQQGQDAPAPLRLLRLPVPSAPVVSSTRHAHRSSPGRSPPVPAPDPAPSRRARPFTAPSPPPAGRR